MRQPTCDDSRLIAAPKILAQKARRLRKETGDERWYAPCGFSSPSTSHATDNTSGEIGSIVRIPDSQYLVQAIHYGRSRADVGCYHPVSVGRLRYHVLACTLSAVYTIRR